MSQFESFKNSVTASLAAITAAQSTTATNSTNNAKTGWTNNRTGSGEWRQYKHWCHTYGVNISHNSDGCRRRSPAHDLTSTKDNPKNGNVKRNGLWMQWNSPLGVISATRME